MTLLTFAIGDIHGCLGKLRRLMRACESYAAGMPARYVFLGDYIDRGPRSREVIDQLMTWQRERPGQVVCLRGNHEEMALHAHADARAMPVWLQNSGESTRQNYRDNGCRISDRHLSWLDGLPYCHDDGLRFFVHAGIDLAIPLDAQPPAVMLWMREPFLTLSDDIDCGRFVVHGHTPRMNGEPDLRRHRVNLDTAAVVGGPLTAGVFDDRRAEPIAFLNDRRSILRWFSRLLRAREAA